MARPLLTVGCATIRDYHGLYFTLQSLRLDALASDDLKRLEFVVVDQDPKSEHGEANRGLSEGFIAIGSQGARYIPMPEARGTTQPRQRIFDEARGEFTLVLDSHVLLAPGTLKRILQFCWTNPDDSNINSGPLLYDDLGQAAKPSTHFEPGWRGGMWGKWATDLRGVFPEQGPFPIWAQGLGMFLCRTAAWPGFDRRWRGFGGEEGCIHEVFRQRGDQAICHPGWPWLHRFAKPGGVSVPAYTYSKVRNYVMGFQRINRDIDEIRQHFVVQLANDPDPNVRRSSLKSTEWDYLVEHLDEELPPGVKPIEQVETQQGPTNYVAEPSNMSQPPNVKSIGAISEWAATLTRDLDQHRVKLASLATGKRVVELTKRRESTLYLMSGHPKSLLSFTAENDAVYNAIHWAIKQENPQWLQAFTHGRLASVADSLAVEIPECDVLFIDTEHSGERIYQELTRHGSKVAETVIVRGTGAFGERAESGGGPGLLHGVNRWIDDEAKRGREWVRIYSTDVQYGLSVYSCDPDAVDVDLGPGTMLASILRQLGIVSTVACSCKEKQRRMDQLGAQGCRDNLDEVVGWITEGAPQWGWADRLKAGALAVATGLAFSINPLDPYRSLVLLAIERSEAKIKARAERATAAKGGAA